MNKSQSSAVLIGLGKSLMEGCKSLISRAFFAVVSKGCFTASASVDESRSGFEVVVSSPGLTWGGSDEILEVFMLGILKNFSYLETVFDGRRTDVI